MPDLSIQAQVFVGAFAGSIFVEIVALYLAFGHDPPLFPPRFKYWLYYPLRLVLAVGVASIAVGEGISTVTAAVTFGAMALPALDAASGGAIKGLFKHPAAS